MSRVAEGLAKLNKEQKDNLVSDLSKLVVFLGSDPYFRIWTKKEDRAFNTAGFGSSRFSSRTNEFKIIYGASDLDTALMEVIVRDRFDLLPSGKRNILWNELGDKVASVFSEVTSPELRLLDLTDERAQLFGVPSGVFKNSNHIDGQDFAEFIYKQLSIVHGFKYSSRLTGKTCIALFYDRAAGILTELDGPMPLDNIREVIPAFERLRIRVVK